MFANAKDVCSRALQFSGRSDRYEFWSFVWFLFLVSIALVIINVMIFGPTESTEYKVTNFANGEQRNQIIHKKSYDAGWLGTILYVLAALPLLSVGWRRLQDTGRHGMFLLTPVLGFALAAGIFLMGSTHVPIEELGFPTDANLPETIRMPNGAFVTLAAWFCGAASVVATIVMLARQSQPGPNKYGPNPDEVAP